MALGADADATVVVRTDLTLHAVRTLAAVRFSSSDPTSALHGDTVWKARRTLQGPATVAARPEAPGAIRFWAWGPGSQAALADAPDWLGLDDPLESFDPSPHPVIEKLARSRRGIRMGRFGDVFDRLVPTVFGQLVIAKEAKRSYRRLVHRFSAAAPGPLDLRLPPAADDLAELGSHHFHSIGVERRRAAIVQRLARDAPRLDRLVGAPLEDAYRYLRRFPGVGPWTAAGLGRVAFGDPDSVITGDYNLPHTVAWALAGKRRSNDDEMLELLEPFAGHRGRVQAMVKSQGKPPRRGAKTSFREIERH